MLTTLKDVKAPGGRSYRITLAEDGRIFYSEFTSKGRILRACYAASVEAAERVIAEKIAVAETREVERKTRAATKKAALASLANPFKVGDVFVNSWGYEQTNVDFYEVVEVGRRTVTVREIACETAGEGGAVGPFAGHVVARRGEFLEKSAPKRCLVQAFVKADGTVGEAYIRTGEHGWTSKWDGKPEYTSWGH